MEAAQTQLLNSEEIHNRSATCEPTALAELNTRVRADLLVDVALFAEAAAGNVPAQATDTIRAAGVVAELATSNADDERVFNATLRIIRTILAARLAAPDSFDFDDLQTHVNVFSNLLGTGECSRLETLTPLLNALIGTAHVLTVPNETLNVTSENANVTTARYEPGESIEMALPGSDVVVKLPGSVTEDLDNVFGVQIVYGSAFRDCRRELSEDSSDDSVSVASGGGSVLLGDIVSVDIGSAGADGDNNVDANADVKTQNITGTKTGFEYDIIILVPVDVSSTATIDALVSECRVARSSGAATAVDGKEVDTIIEVELPDDEGKISVDWSLLSCAFWDEDDESWSDVGCVVLNATTPGPDRLVIECGCNHVTEFDVVYDSLGECLEPKFGRPVLMFFSLAYCAVMISCGIVPCELHRAQGAWREYTILGAQLALLFCIARFRFLTTSLYAIQFQGKLDGMTVLLISALPYMFLYSLYTLLAVSWMWSVHVARTMSRESLLFFFRRPTAHVPFYAFNGVLSACTVGFVATAAVVGADNRDVLLVWCCVLGFASIGTAIVMSADGGTLLCHLSTNSSSVARRGMAGAASAA